jgi:hypothetical protein
MVLSIKRLACSVVIASMFVGLGATRTLAADRADVIVASGTLDGRFLAAALFHIDEFWMRINTNTEFNRWLSGGLTRKVVVLLTTDPDRFGDRKNTRILTGTLHHETAPQPTPTTTNVVGRLPKGNSGFVHVVFLKDERTGSLGAVTFETADLVTAAAFDIYEGATVSVVISIDGVKH